MSNSAEFDNPKTRHKTAVSALEESLSVLEHEDPNKHFIGESLPVASDADLQPVGITPTAGQSVFPARADHVHPISVPYSVGISPGIGSPLIIPNGGVRYYVNNWVHNGGEDWIGASPQTIDFPYSGFYNFNFYINMTAELGGGMGAGYLQHGVRFTNSIGGVFDYQFTNHYVELGELNFFDSRTQYHLSGDLPGHCQYWVTNFLPVNVKINTLQYVGVFLGV